MENAKGQCDMLFGMFLEAPDMVWDCQKIYAYMHLHLVFFVIIIVFCFSFSGVF